MSINNIINEEIFKTENHNFLQEYLKLIIARETYSAMLMDPKIENPESYKYSTYFYDNMNAFNFLLSTDNFNKEISEDIIIKVANLVNKSNELVSDGYRNIGDHNYETNIETPSSNKLSEAMNGLIDIYNEKDENHFINEAILHIGIIRYQPFEDGNHRTANIILNCNLLKQGYAPAIIDTEEIRKEYIKYINEGNVIELAKLLERQSENENKVLNILFENHQKDICKNNQKK